MAAAAVPAKADYSDARYWEHQYHDDTAFSDFEWYLSLEEYTQLLLGILAKTDGRVLNIGGGTSGLGAALYEAGRKHLVNIDISRSCIEKMRAKYAAMSEMEWLEMDATALTLADASFDYVIDKATSDVFLAVKKSKMPAAREQVLSLFREAWRVLKPEGTLVIITRFRPRKEQVFFDALGWKNVTHTSLPAPRVYSGRCHVYTVKKTTESEEAESKRARVELNDSGGSDDDTSSDDSSFAPEESGSEASGSEESEGSREEGDSGESGEDAEEGDDGGEDS